ncbi:MAG: hypothetical protein RBR86_09960 [Pseudobdellovibrionaceae bacterium]|jgi:hypothetical protein|nr:hypothetical protein [Pseudobdellovibrionaceae bacterium]
MTTKVELDDDIRSVTETKLGQHGEASAGFASGLRPAAQITAGVSKEESTVKGSKTTNTISSVDVRGQVALAQNPRIDVTAKINVTQTDAQNADHSLVVNAGIRVSKVLGSSLEVIAAVRGDYEQQGLNRLSPYFKVTASTKGEATAEIGACTTPGHKLAEIEFPRVCAGVNIDQNGKSRIVVGTGFTF